MLILIGVFICASAGRERLKLRSSSGFSTTSSTLEWVPRKPESDIPLHAVYAIQDSNAWCRGELYGLWIPGVTDNVGKCYIPFLNTIHEIDKHDILVSINGSAKLEYFKWDSLTAIPEKALLSPDFLLVLGKGHENEVIPGNLGLKERYALLHSGNKTVKAKNALILMEEEPVKYSLSNIEFNTVRDETKEKQVLLGTVVRLENDLYIQHWASKLLEYEVRETQYWGRVKGTLTALPALIYPPRCQPFTIVWGINNEFARFESAILEYRLHARHAVNVSIVGTLRRYEAQYRGVLTSHFKDGTNISRDIVSFHSHEILIKAIATYSRPYSVDTGEEIDTTSRSEVVYEQTTTTTTSTTTALTDVMTYSELVTFPVILTSAEDVEGDIILPSQMHPESLSKEPLQIMKDNVTGDVEEIVTYKEVSGKASNNLDYRIVNGLATLISTLLFKYFYYIGLSVA